METFKYEKIRNVALLGHGGCGKTTLVEAMAFTTGVISRQGKVEEGNTISDFDKEEAKRQFSISTSVVPVIWEGTKINVLDTPGYFDFVGEVEEALHAADAAVIVVSAKSGIEVGVMKAWDLCEKFKLPRMFFVTDMDDDKASYRDVVNKLEKLYGRKIAPFQFPIREDEKFVGYVNVVKMMDNNLIKGASDIIPAYIDKEQNVSLSKPGAVTKSDFENLQKQVNKTIKQIAKEMLSGNINIKPYYSTKTKKTPCEYCKYKSICNFDESECKGQYRYIPNYDKNVVLDSIRDK